MRLFLRFFARPYPLGGGADVADDRLPALGDMDVLDRHLLLALRAVFLQGRDLRGEGPCQFVERPLGAVLLRDAHEVRQAASESPRGHMDGAASIASTCGAARYP